VKKEVGAFLISLSLIVLWISGTAAYVLSELKENGSMNGETNFFPAFAGMLTVGLMYITAFFVVGLILYPIICKLFKNK
jgi:hypothetical protein